MWRTKHATDCVASVRQQPSAGAAGWMQHTGPSGGSTGPSGSSWWSCTAGAPNGGCYE